MRSTKKHGFYVEVTPRGAGDYGWAIIGGMTRTEKEEESLCQEIASQIRRHVEGIGRDGVHIRWESSVVCEHCGADWTGDSPTFNGGCCDKDRENEIGQVRP